MFERGFIYLVIVDMHCDALSAAFSSKRSLAVENQEGHVDIPRLKKGGIGIQFFALFGADPFPCNALLYTLQLLDFFWEEYYKNQDLIEPILSCEDIQNCIESGKIGALLVIEGGEALAGSIEVLRIFYRLGIRGIGLTWNYRNEIADGISENRTGGGLTTFGAEVVKEMNRLGMLIDVSHISERGFWDVLELSNSPVVASHSNCRSVWDHPRNLTDEQIKAIAEKEGVIGLNFVPDFLGPPGAGLNFLLKHIDHICNLVGDDYLGFGSDFDGIKSAIPEIPDASYYSVLIEALQRHGFSDTTIRKICSENCLRLLRKILKK